MMICSKRIDSRKEREIVSIFQRFEIERKVKESCGCILCEVGAKSFKSESSSSAFRAIEWRQCLIIDFDKRYLSRN